MDIGFNRHLSYDELDDFLSSQVDCSYFIVYNEEHYRQNDWDKIKDEQLIIHYINGNLSNRELLKEQKKQNFDRQDNFNFGISIYPIKPEIEYLPLLENMAFRLAKFFSCSSFCDASRLLLVDTLHSPYYSLLYEEDKVYLVNDYSIEESGCLIKIIELSYSLPSFRW